MASYLEDKIRLEAARGFLEDLQDLKQLNNPVRWVRFHNEYDRSDILSLGLELSVPGEVAYMLSVQVDIQHPNTFVVNLTKYVSGAAVYDQMLEAQPRLKWDDYLQLFADN